MTPDEAALIGLIAIGLHEGLDLPAAQHLATAIATCDLAPLKASSAMHAAAVEAVYGSGS